MLCHSTSVIFNCQVIFTLIKLAFMQNKGLFFFLVDKGFSICEIKIAVIF